MSGQTANLRARCEPELAARVEDLAKQWRLKPSDIVRIALEDYLARRAGAPNPLLDQPISYAAGPGPSPDQIVAEAAARTIAAALPDLPRDTLSATRIAPTGDGGTTTNAGINTTP